jgi:glucose/arabinose dehydrogenase
MAGMSRREGAMALVLVLLALLVPPVPASAQTEDFEVVDVFSGLDRPMAIEFAPNGDVFVAEKDGVLKVFDGVGDSDGPDVVFDWTNIVQSFNDRGLLGMAVDSDYANGRDYVYLLYTFDEEPFGTNPPRYGDACPNGLCTVTAKVSRVEVDPSTNLMVGGELVLVEDHWCMQFTGHSNADLEFSDGYLYASAGDGASSSFVDQGQNGGIRCDDPTGQGGALKAQDVLTSVGGEAGDPVSYSGSIIRIDPDTGAAPPDNPLVGGSVAGDDRVIAHGLRNPFRMAVRPGTDELWIGDVGWETTEEINLVADVNDSVVENFGWPCYEGDAVQGSYSAVTLCNQIINDTLTPTVATTKTDPFFPYNHGSTLDGCGPSSNSVSGLAFGDTYSYPAAYDGALFFADYSRACLFAMQTGAGGVPDGGQIELLASDVKAIDLKVGPGGGLFLVDPGNFSNGSGTIRRLVFQSGTGTPTAAISASPLTGEVGTTSFEFDGSASSDPDGDTLTYAWDVDGDGSFDATTTFPTTTYTHIYPNPGTYQVRLRVTDPTGASDDATVTVNVSNDPPVATIDTPADISPAPSWRAGDTITFTGSGSDTEDGTLAPDTPGQEWEWNVILHHCPAECHQHPLESFTGVNGGSFDAPDHEYPSFLEFRLTVFDSTGASHTDSVEVHPYTSIITLETNPGGLQLTAGGAGPQTTPFTIEAIQNGQISITAPTQQTQTGTNYTFTSWSNQNPQSHDITIPTNNQTLTATYSIDTDGDGISDSDEVLAGTDPTEPPAQVGLFDSASGQWHLRSADGSSTSFFYGNPGDVPLMGDWDCDGIDTVGAYRASSGFAYLRNSNDFGFADIQLFFGDPGDIPIVGDWDGDGCDTLGVYRGGHVFLTNALVTGDADIDFWFGNPGDVPFTGDFDDDGLSEIGLYRESAGLTYMRWDYTTGIADHDFYFGNPGDEIIAGDWDNDYTDTVGIWRAQEATFYLTNTNDTGTADQVIPFGNGLWAPVAGNFL